MKHREIDFAKIRYRTNELENLAISAYAGDPAKLGQIDEIYARAVHDMHVVATEGGAVLCPWEVCEDGSCRPRCPGSGPQPTPAASDGLTSG